MLYVPPCQAPTSFLSCKKSKILDLCSDTLWYYYFTLFRALCNVCSGKPLIYCVVHSIWAHFCVFQSQCVHFVKASRLIMAVKGAIFHLYSINSEQPRVLDSSDVLPKLFQIFADCKTKLHKILFHTVWILLEQLLFFLF